VCCSPYFSLDILIEIIHVATGGENVCALVYVYVYITTGEGVLEKYVYHCWNAYKDLVSIMDLIFEWDHQKTSNI